MARKHKPKEIIGSLREAEIVLVQGVIVADACRSIGVTEQSYYRWRKEYGGGINPEDAMFVNAALTKLLEARN